MRDNYRQDDAFAALQTSKSQNLRGELGIRKAMTLFISFVLHRVRHLAYVRPPESSKGGLALAGVSTDAGDVALTGLTHGSSS